MSNRGHLIPTPTVDKNGVQTTVYKRAFDIKKADALSQVTVPPLNPASTEEESPVEARARMINDVSDSVYDDYQNNISFDYIQEIVTGYPDETIAYLHKSLVETRYRDRGLYGYLLSEYVEEGKPASAINEVATFITKLQNKHDNTVFVAKLLSGIRQYPQLPKMDDYSKADPRTQQQIVALLSATERLYEERHNPSSQGDWDGPNTIRVKDAMVLGDESLVDLIMARPEEAERIVDFMISARTSVIERITKTLNEGTSPLDDGLL